MSDVHNHYVTVINNTAPALTDPDLWESVADAIGEHPYSYDMSDSSHRLDVVQIVCSALDRVHKRQS